MLPIVMVFIVAIQLAFNKSFNIQDRSDKIMMDKHSSLEMISRTKCSF